MRQFHRGCTHSWFIRLQLPTTCNVLHSCSGCIALSQRANGTIVPAPPSVATASSVWRRQTASDGRTYPKEADRQQYKKARPLPQSHVCGP